MPGRHRLSKFVLNIFLALMCLAPFSTQASRLESLIMPGPLIEGHAKYENDCEKCHASFSKNEQTLLCASCHEDIKKDLQAKQGFHGKNIFALQQNCKQCHTDHKGRDANIIQLDRETFNHAATDFSLQGAHRRLACHSCHKQEKKYREAPSACYSCHKEDDAHDGLLGKKCASCHNENAWKKISFDHDKTDFPLKGKHQDALCQSCHPDNRHKHTPSQCFACHALDDAHRGRYGNKCHTCHNPQDWKKAWFDHNKKTDYPLIGRHSKVRCDACHTGPENIYQKKPGNTCFACHKSDDIHKGKNGNKCQQCHTPKSWASSKFSHNRDTDFPLKGKHGKLQCSACHQGDIHKNKLKTDCLSCHRVDDVHKGQQGKHCQRCHNEQGWTTKISFNHDLSSFPLNGQHAIITCEECHASKEFKDTSSACYSCHEKDDEHKKTLGPHCNQCHNPNSWSLWLFDHNRQTGFVLDGAHQNLKCSACHTEPTSGRVERSATCATCHYRDDAHRGGFGKYCDQCHTTKSFNDLKL